MLRLPWVCRPRRQAARHLVRAQAEHSGLKQRLTFTQPAACMHGSLRCCTCCRSACLAISRLPALPRCSVRASEAATECPRTAIGEEGAPCGTGGACNAARNLTCCENIHFLGGLTSVKVSRCSPDKGGGGRAGHTGVSCLLLMPSPRLLTRFRQLLPPALPCRSPRVSTAATDNYPERPNQQASQPLPLSANSCAFDPLISH